MIGVTFLRFDLVNEKLHSFWVFRLSYKGCVEVCAIRLLFGHYELAQTIKYATLVSIFLNKIVRMVNKLLD